MTTRTNPSEQTRLKRLDDAGQWLLRMQDPGRTEEQLNEWLRWIDADPGNLAEFERLQRDWNDLDALKGDGLVLTPQHNSARLRQENGHRVGRRLVAVRSTWIVAAAVTAVAVLLGVSRYQWIVSEQPTQQVTAALMNRAATLPDGSRMILGAQSRVNVDFNGPKRRLDLSVGEAYFEVEHDKSRPFVVHAGDVSVTAIGTAFDVRRQHDQVTITVEEGTVEVSGYASGKQPVTWRAQAGYQLTYSIRLRTASIASVNPLAELAWRNGELAYVREPLGAVVEDLNRYSVRRIVIEDPEIADLPFTGTAFAASVGDWAQGIQQVYPVEVRETPSGDLILRSRLH